MVPGSGAGAAAPKAEFIHVTSVPALFFLNPSTRTYEGKGTGNIGCVIVGAVTSYNLMFYDASKTTLLKTPVVPQVRTEAV